MYYYLTQKEHEGFENALPDGFVFSTPHRDGFKHYTEMSEYWDRSGIDLDQVCQSVVGLDYQSFLSSIQDRADAYEYQIYEFRRYWKGEKYWWPEEVKAFLKRKKGL